MLNAVTWTRSRFQCSGSGLFSWPIAQGMAIIAIRRIGFTQDLASRAIDAVQAWRVSTSIVSGNSVDVVDYQHVYRTFLSDQAQPELLLNRGEDGSAVRI